MKLFYSDNNELLVGWKALRVFVIGIALVVLFAILAALLHFKPLEDYAVHLAMILSVLLCLQWERKPLSYIGFSLRDKAFWTDSLFGFAWGCLFIGLVAVGMTLITGELQTSQLGAGFTVSGLAYSLVFWFVVALGEETLFRGYIFSILRQRMNLWVALIISACLFSAIHFINPGYYWFAYVYALLIGIAFGGILIKRGNLGGAIGFHYAWNLLQDRGILNMPERGGEAIYAVILLVMAVFVFWALPSGSIQNENSVHEKAPNTASS